jgi:hypothetical protein
VEDARRGGDAPTAEIRRQRNPDVPDPPGRCCRGRRRQADPLPSKDHPDRKEATGRPLASSASALHRFRSPMSLARTRTCVARRRRSSCSSGVSGDGGPENELPGMRTTKQAPAVATAAMRRPTQPMSLTSGPSNRRTILAVDIFGRGRGFVRRRSDVVVADECHRGYTTAEESAWRKSRLRSRRSRRSGEATKRSRTTPRSSRVEQH